ncbi:MAG TPA: GNAT family N-acetyltransferase [Candidatus Binataceae bacterium]|nr:GNAT family N-acetyltransferase [Candidatus Binataceae bacterium]
MANDLSGIEDTALHDSHGRNLTDDGGTGHAHKNGRSAGRPSVTNLNQGSARSPDPNIKFEPLENARDQWRALVGTSAQVTLYHSEPWIEALRLTYGFSFRAAIIEHKGVPHAGVLFARVRRPFARWWVALPFSDACPPLTVEPAASPDLFARLPEFFGHDRFEIRGICPPSQWQGADHFLSWDLDVSGSAPGLYRGLETNFRRNLTKALKSRIKIEHGNSIEMVTRFFRLHQQSRRRLGLPCQPWRFFYALRQCFADSFDVWLASHQGQDIAAVFLLAHRETLHYKWSARASNETSGAGHLLTWSLVEEAAGRFQLLDLGRSDIRNSGLNRFKHGLGGRSSVLPYAFFPVAPHNPSSSEVLSTRRRIMTDVWKLVPSPLCRGIERFAYRYLS